MVNPVRGVKVLEGGLIEKNKHKISLNYLNLHISLSDIFKKVIHFGTLQIYSVHVLIHSFPSTIVDVIRGLSTSHFIW